MSVKLRWKAENGVSEKVFFLIFGHIFRERGMGKKLPSGKSFLRALFSVKLQQTIYHRKSNKMKNSNIWTF